jgi:RHS repeat-associated protein
VLAESDLSGAIQVEYVYFNGRRIAQRDVAGGNTHYYLTDHIGSARVVTNAAGAIVEESDFYPFGTERVVTDTMNNTIKFAGMERDTESALDHTLYRQYSASLARWLSPDIEQGSPSMPQSLNRYGYVLNDPLRLIDPLGADPDFDPFMVGCFPDPFFGGFFNVGCGWNPLEDPCPPGFEPIYGNPRPDGVGPAIESLQSVLQYSHVRLRPYSPGVLGYELGPNGVSVSMTESDFRSLAAFNPVLVETLPYVISGGRVLIELLRIATVALFADILDHLYIECKYNGGNQIGDKPGTKTCVYDCDDGSTYLLEEVPMSLPCPDPLVRIRSVFLWY